jgi:acylphosphatase
MSNEPLQTRFYRVVGRVQGVGFRAFVRAEARRLALVGWVRNAADGSVELEASGPVAALDELAARLAVGPSAARVERVEAIERERASRADVEFVIVR